jgi:4-amino-4-deoxy-L-arabinose transferase-like glycosyltransferase
VGLLARTALAALVLLLAAVTLQNLVRPLANPDEGRYSEISREMAESGDWVTPRLNGLLYFEKPPLQYWAGALAFRAFGVSEWSARLYVTLCAWGVIALVAFTAARLGTRADAAGAVIALVASPYFMALSGAVTLDMGLTLWLTLALCAWLLAERSGIAPRARRRWMLAAWAAMALAVLSKGLVGIVIPAASLALTCALRRDFSPLARLEWLRGGALFLAIAAPWFVAVSIANPGFAEFFFIHEHFTRFLTTQHRRAEPWWFFLPIVALGFLPWAASLPEALATAWRERRGKTAPLLPAMIWAAFVVVFFSASGSKLPAYVLPAFPPLALVLGRHLARAREASLAAWMLPAVALTAAATWFATRAAERAREPWAKLLYADAEPWLVGAGAAITAGLVASIALLLRRRRWAGLLAAAIGVAAFLACALQAFESFAPRQSGKILGDRVRAAATPDTRIYSVDIYDQSTTFYIGRPVILVKIRDELDLGLAADPSRWLPTIEDFAADWQRPGDAVAIMQPGLFHVFRTQGLPMELVHEDPRRILVRKP